MLIKKSELEKGLKDQIDIRVESKIYCSNIGIKLVLQSFIRLMHDSSDDKSPTKTTQRTLLLSMPTQILHNNNKDKQGECYSETLKLTQL